MTLEELIARTRELDAKATKGPFDVSFGEVARVRSKTGTVANATNLTNIGRREANEVEANAKLFAFYRTAAPALADALEAETRRREEISGNYKQMDEWNGRLVRELESERAKVKVARDALAAEERHQWAVRNLEAVSDPLDERILGLKMEVERTTHEASILRKEALTQLNQ